MRDPQDGPKWDPAIIAELERLFDEEHGSTISDPQGRVEAEVRFIDYCLIAVDDAKRFGEPTTQAEVRKQLDRVSKALSQLGPEARDHIEQQLGYSITDIQAPGPIDEMMAATGGYTAGSTRNAQAHRLLDMAQAIWPGERLSRYRDSRSPGQMACAISSSRWACALRVLPAV